jgi:hypothetical protein
MSYLQFYKDCIFSVFVRQDRSGKKNMNPLVKMIVYSVGKFSPEVSDHLIGLVRESYVSIVHMFNARRCQIKYKDRNGIHLNLGCGPYIKGGYLNFDFFKIG